MKYSDLQPCDMFSTMIGRYVKQLDGSAMVVAAPYAGQTTKLSDDFDVIPLYVAKDRVNMRAIVDAADELSRAIWNLPEVDIVQNELERFDALVGAARKAMQ